MIEWGLEPIEGAKDAGRQSIIAASTDVLEESGRISGLRLAGFYFRNYCHLLFVFLFSFFCLRQT